MKNLTRRVSVVFLLALGCISTTGSYGSPLRQAHTHQPYISLEERKAILTDKLKVKPLDLSRYKVPSRPFVVDYSDLVTYIRCQNHGGGCMTYATLYAADIINEFQAPYTPDLSWQYALRTWDEVYNDRVLNQGVTEAPGLNEVFNPGVSSEGLCRSESDYLTEVSATDPKLVDLGKTRMFYDPAPTAEAIDDALRYKYKISDPITPDVDVLKTLLITYGPVWASGGWWWNGAHAMCFIGYDDTKQEFKGVNSSGDWADNHGFWSIPYDKLATYVNSLRVVEMIPTDRYQGRWAYSSRFRIRGTWRGTWTVKIGVQGQPSLTVYRTYGRMGDRPYAYGERLDLDVPLPAYAAQFWPPRTNAKWYLQVENNDRDGQTGYVREWILARRYEDPQCHSVDHWKTETFKYSKQVNIPDATGEPIADPKPSPSNAAPPQPNSEPGVAILYLPEGESANVLGIRFAAAGGCKILFDVGNCTLSPGGEAILRGKLSAVLTGNGLADKAVELFQLTPTKNVNKPPIWKRIATAQTSPEGTFEFKPNLPVFVGKEQIFGAACRGDDGLALCSTTPMVREKNVPRWEKNVPRWKEEMLYEMLYGGRRLAPAPFRVPGLDLPRPMIPK